MSGTKHSKLSASSCERWWNCPGSIKACERLPNPPKVYTAEGTVAHALAEALLTGRDNTDYVVGAVIMQDGFEIEITDEMYDNVAEYVEYVRQVIQDAGPSAIVRFEQKVELEEVNAVMFGTADVVIEVPFKIIHAIDLKYGKGKRVSAWQNKQGMYYALAVAMKADCPKFKIHICQPRVDDGFTTYEGDEEELKKFENELREKATLALSDKAPLVPGNHCRGSFCPASNYGCVALSGLTREVTVNDFDDVPVPQTLTIEQIVKVLKYEDTINDWMSKVREYAKEIMIQGCEVPGYKIVQSLGHAEWIDTEAIVAEFGDEYGEKIYKPVEKEVLSPAQFEKLVGKKKLGKDFREEYTRRPDRGFKIVENDEKGEPVKTIKAEEDF